eukprot:SAG11_NODE_20020_length_454_cov_1.016901_1_plen_76_part_10
MWKNNSWRVSSVYLTPQETPHAQQQPILDLYVPVPAVRWKFTSRLDFRIQGARNPHKPVAPALDAPTVLYLPLAGD